MAKAIQELIRENEENGGYNISIDINSIIIEYISEDLVNVEINNSAPNLNINLFFEFITNNIFVQNISTFVDNTNLGTLPEHRPEERNRKILEELKKINSTFSILDTHTQEISIRDITNTSATISANPRSQNYFGSFTVTFNLDANQGNRTDENDKNCDDSDDSSSKEKEPKENEIKKLVSTKRIKNTDDITSAKRIKQNYKGKNLHSGDLFVGTKNGLLLLINGLIITVDNISDQVNKIDYYENKDIYALTNKQEIFLLKTDTISDNSVVAEKIENATSTDLDKEISLFYEKKHDVITSDWYYQHEHIIIVQEFDLHKVNPLNYSKIEFLGDNEDFSPTKVSWSRFAYASDKKINDFNGSNLSDLLRNQKFQDKNQDQISNEISHNELKKRIEEIDEDSSKHYLPSIIIQPKQTKYYTLVEWIEFEQDFEIAFYWEKGHYYLQVIARQYSHDNPGSSYGGSLWMGFGNGIKLYNE